MKITAILAVRDEERYLRVVLRHLVDSGLRLAIIDHGSTDSTRRIIDSFADHLDDLATMPYLGHFSLTDQLAAKAEVVARLDADWLIHQDADEILESPRPGESLRCGIERAACEGYSAINFDEFVFVPTHGGPGFEGTDFYRSMLDYYFFEPMPMRLMRAWRNGRGVRQDDGGHRLRSETPLAVCPEGFILRHYIALSQEQADTKYRRRRFAPEDLARGWHANRLDVPPVVRLPDPPELHRLPSWSSKAFERGSPRRVHFWQPGWRAIPRPGVVDDGPTAAA